jgi:hypothetical protein
MASYSLKFHGFFMLVMVLEPEKLHLGNKVVFVLPWTLLDLQTYSWFTTNPVMVSIPNLKVNDTLHIGHMCWLEDSSIVFVTKKRETNLSTGGSCFPHLTMVKDLRPIHDAQDLIMVPIFNSNAKYYMESAYVVVCRCCSCWLNSRNSIRDWGHCPPLTMFMPQHPFLVRKI